MNRNSEGICPLCGGDRKPGSTLFSVDLGSGVVVVRNVPASVCSQCGKALIGADIARKFEAIVAEAREKKRLVEVLEMA